MRVLRAALRIIVVARNQGVGQILRRATVLRRQSVVSNEGNSIPVRGAHDRRVEDIHEISDGKNRSGVAKSIRRRGHRQFGIGDDLSVAQLLPVAPQSV